MTDGSMVLLGAGASADGGIPTSRDMTRQMVEVLEKSDRVLALHRRDVANAYRYVWSQIAAHLRQPELNPDIELVFSAAELLAERGDLEATPFVAAWDPGVAEMDNRLKYFDSDRVGRAVTDLINDSLRGFPHPSNVDDAVRDVIRQETGLGGSGGTFAALLDAMLQALRELTALPSVDRFDYLIPLFNLAERQGRVTVATLNYDRSVEEVGAVRGRDVYTGIEGWAQSGEWPRPDTGLSLLKLHGSIDWWLVPQRGTAGFLPARRVSVGEVPPEPDARPCVLFGQRTKLRADGPFLDLLREFANALEEATRLIVVGYSFRDPHVNEYVTRWINGSLDRSRRLIVIDPNFPEQPNYFFPTGRDFRIDLERFLSSPRHTAPSAQTFEPRLVIHRRAARACLEQVLHAA